MGKKISIYLVIAVIFFLLGYYKHKPREKIIEKEVMVYDLTQKPKLIEAYANTVGKTLMNLDEYKVQKSILEKEIMDLKLKSAELKLDIAETKYKRR